MPGRKETKKKEKAPEVKAPVVKTPAPKAPIVKTAAPKASEVKAPTQKLQALSLNPRQKLELLFEKYKELGSERIGPDGVTSLCTDLTISPTSVTTLVLAWKLNAAEMGYFSKAEFVDGLEKLGCSEIQQIVGTLKKLEKDAQPYSKDFIELFSFAFAFCCEGEIKKSVDIETAVAMLQLLLPNSPHIEKFSTFLKQTKSIKVLNKDQWMCFLDFSKNVKGDLTNYDSSESWPLLIDEYVEFVQNK